jgi:branched-chain amino acid transport system substrate-binding protein
VRRCTEGDWGHNVTPVGYTRRLELDDYVNCYDTAITSTREFRIEASERGPMKFTKLMAVGTTLAVVVALSALPANAAKKKTTTTKKKPTTTKVVAVAPVTTAAAAAPAKAKGLLWDNGPCKPSVPEYKVGIIAPFQTPILSLIDQVNALEASVKAFNARGGVGGHCMALTTCDSKANPNQELDCARQFVDKGIVATLNDTTSFNPQGVLDLFLAAGLPRVGVSPSSQDLSAAAIPITYAFGAGGAGTTLMMVPPCVSHGFKKIGMINVDTPQIAGLIGLMQTELKAYGATLVGNVAVPAGTTDFQQFTLAMESKGAECTILPLGENEAKQVLRAAQQLGGTMRFSGSLGTFGLADLAAFGNFGSFVYLNAELPPASASQTTFPILKDAIADLSASGKPELQREQLKSSPLRSWVSVYAFIKVIEQFGKPDDISRKAINDAFKTATNVDMFGLTPLWTPNGRVLPSTHPFYGPFGSVSMPWYYQAQYNPATKAIDVSPNKLMFTNEVTGVTDYPQPK